MIAQADAADLSEVLALLEEVDLPKEGVAEHISEFFVAREGGKLIGCVGQERYGNVALLRSLAVSPSLQRSGLGRALTMRLLDEARANGVREFVLLTTTARDFFARHFGFVEAERREFNEAFANSPEWCLPRCSLAVCMRWALSCA
jgi:amino-acid N-acetyltransferase